MNNLATAQPTPTDTDVMQQYLREILLSPVYQAAVETPTQPMAKLSLRLNQQIWLKREDKQPVYSFKLRGAFHKLHKVKQQSPDARVVCASAGNHAQGVALSASKLGLQATIVMP
ncbi:pyridoxal-phosphate dependent enzyme, partial [Alkalimonas sp.]|uniref:pyridoxal-phosphate dependent enzyme n=1 Tax=Alkalimonas sp. TaxID=1872453 RepID=UPI00263B89DD